MPSKKRSSRIKASKGGKKVAEQQGTPDTQMQRLKIDENFQADDDALLEEAIKLAASEREALEAAAAEQEETSKSDGCDHGYVKTEDHFIIEDFAKTFTSGFIAFGAGSGAGANIGDALKAAAKATREKYPEVWDDPSKMKLVLSSGDPSKLKLVASHFIANGTQKVLNGDIDGARTFAFFACFSDQYISSILGTKAAIDATKMFELFSADEHTLVNYLRKRVPCNCLDEKYKEVKSITKIGICCNPHCQVPDRMVERRSMLYCTRCRDANYCSPECQKADWPIHKRACDEIVEKKAKFNSKQKKKEKERQAKNTH